MPSQEPLQDADSVSAQSHFDTTHLLVDLRQRSIRGGTVTVVAFSVRFLVGMGAMAVLARLLTPGDFGLLAMVQVVAGFLGLFHDAGLSTATIQRERINQRQVSTLFWLNVLLGVGLMIAMIILAPAVGWYYRDQRLLAITVAMSLVFPITALAIQHRALLNRQMRFTSLAVIGVVSQVLGYLAAIGSALLGASYWSLVIAAMVTALTETTAIILTSRWIPGRPAWASGVQSMVRFGTELTGFEVLNYAAANLDRMLLGRYWGDQMLGLYWGAYRVLLLPLKQINTPIANVAVPTLSRLQIDPERYKRAYLGMIDKLSLLTTPLAVLMIGASDWIIHIFLGPQWDGAADVLFYLGFAAILLPIANTSGWLFVSQGRSRQMLQWGFIDALIKVISVTVGIRWGPVGMAVAVSVRTYLAFPLLWWIVCREGPIRAGDLYRTITPTMVAAGCALAAVWMFRYLAEPTQPVLGIVAVFSITAITMLAVLAAIPAGRTNIRQAYGLVRVLLPGR